MLMDASEAIVERRLEWWPAPAAPETPAAYNRIGVRQFRRPGPRPPAAVLILSPGFSGGVNLLDYVAEVVTAANGGRLQVWTIDRRNNRLEDTRGMEHAEAVGDPRVALAYYCGGERLPAGGGESFVPLAQEQVAFLRHWGLAVALSDLRVVVRRAREMVGPQGKVFLGGHSLGGMLAQCYAAWEFPEGPGHQEIDGLVLVDGAVGGPEWTRTQGQAQYETGIHAMEDGEFYWDEPAKGATPRFGILGQAAALAVALPGWRERPSLVAPLVPDWLPPIPGAVLTNEAALGLVIDAETSPIPSYRAHVGRLGSGEWSVMSGEDVPVKAVNFPSLTTHYAPRTTLPWLGFREAGELTDLRRIAGALRQYDGANGIEWYASRLLNAEVDLSSNLDSCHRDTAALAERHGMRVWHHGEEKVPILGIVTGSSEQRRERYQWYASTVATGDVTILDAPEQEHLDPLFAENDGHNRFLPVLGEWLLSRTPTAE